MILYFKTPTHIYTDKQHFDTKQASMIVQEKEPLSPQKKGCKSVVICTLFYFTKKKHRSTAKKTRLPLTSQLTTTTRKWI